MQWLLQSFLLASALLLGVWVRLPAPVLAGFVLVAVALISSALVSQSACAWVEVAALAVLWIGSLTIWVRVALGDIAWGSYYAALAGRMAVSVWLTARRAARGIWQARWNAAVMAWLLCGAFLWLGA